MGASLPLTLGLANTDAPIQLVDKAAEKFDQFGFLGLYHRDQLPVMRATSALPARRQRGE
jgi:hypothetical protein